MRRCGVAFVMCLMVSLPAFAQAPRIGPFVVDLRVTFPRFPTESPQLAKSKGINDQDLPGLGRGLDVGAHLYLFKWRTMTLGVGGELMTGRSQSTPPAPVPGAPPVVRAFAVRPPLVIPPTVIVPIPRQPVTTRFTSYAPQLSFNFGTGHGWSYISGGIGQSTWPVVPDGIAATPADEAKLKTINYGGGARWFAKKHLAFTFDVRFYAINPGIPNGNLGVSPRTTLLVIGAGLSVRK